MTRPNSKESGQAVVEYILSLVTVIGLTGLALYGFKSSTGKLWQGLAGKIAAPCPTCSTPESIRKKKF